MNFGTRVRAAGKEVSTSWRGGLARSMLDTPFSWRDGGFFVPDGHIGTMVSRSWELDLANSLHQISTHNPQRGCTFWEFDGDPYADMSAEAHSWSRPIGQGHWSWPGIENTMERAEKIGNQLIPVRETRPGELAILNLSD